jgi:L-serine dehydratase
MIGVLDLFRIGIGPSSSHTVGPMRAARRFAAALDPRVDGVEVHLYGSLAATGIGHGTPDAVLAGLAGHEPETVDIDLMRANVADIRATGSIRIDGRSIALPHEAIVMHPLTVLDGHPNGMRFVGRSAGEIVDDQTWFSVGGGFITRDPSAAPPPDRTPVPFPFSSGAELLDRCAQTGMAIHEVMRADELAVRSADELDSGIAAVWTAMDSCIAAGLATSGTLPGGLGVGRRAHDWHEALLREGDSDSPTLVVEWIDVFALAVNEENAAGGRVVTAPTNGAAGIVPAVLKYALELLPAYRDASADVRADAVRRFLLTAAAVGTLYKARASISGAEVGCQGEVGSASSMAAAGLAELLGASPAQVENAAEIAMEHNLGLSCDPVGGLVQIPCIERNAVGAAKAVNAASIAMRGDGTHRVSLDQVIETMRQTGMDMHEKYKETSRGGLAVNVIEC